MIKRFVHRKKINDALNSFDEICRKFHNRQVDFVRGYFKKRLCSNVDKFIAALQGGIAIEQIVYVEISNITEFLLKSGQFHIYRGALDSLGNDLLELYNISMDNLVKMKTISREESTAQKKVLMTDIGEMG